MSGLPFQKPHGGICHNIQRTVLKSFAFKSLEEKQSALHGRVYINISLYTINTVKLYTPSVSSTGQGLCVFCISHHASFRPLENNRKKNPAILHKSHGAPRPEEWFASCRVSSGAGKVSVIGTRLCLILSPCLLVSSLKGRCEARERTFLSFFGHSLISLANGLVSSYLTTGPGERKLNA